LRPSKSHQALLWLASATGFISVSGCQLTTEICIGATFTSLETTADFGFAEMIQDGRDHLGSWQIFQTGMLFSYRYTVTSVRQQRSVTLSLTHTHATLVAHNNRIIITVDDDLQTTS
jgi:hypothetical protein